MEITPKSFESVQLDNDTFQSVEKENKNMNMAIKEGVLKVARG